MAQSLPHWARIPLHRASLHITEHDANKNIIRSPITIKQESHPPSIQCTPKGSKEALFVEEQHRAALQSMHKEIELLKAENKGMYLHILSNLTFRFEIQGSDAPINSPSW